jgi:hypothetical protein
MFQGGKMPFIRGRYHLNPVLGEALEAAREAESALEALEQDAEGSASESGDEVHGRKAPIHRVEIEAAELVPALSGRAGRGYVARIHRGVSSQTGSETGRETGRENEPGEAQHGAQGSSRMIGKGQGPETQVFSDHRDLANFLRDELARDAEQ